MLQHFFAFLLISIFFPFQAGDWADSIENKRLLSPIKAENPIFQNIVASGKNGEYEISGQARPLKGEFFYSVEDGHNELIPLKRVKTDYTYPKWSNFHISIYVKKPFKGTLILYLIEKEQNGTIIHSLPIVLEKG